MKGADSVRKTESAAPANKDRIPTGDRGLQQSTLDSGSSITDKRPPPRIYIDRQFYGADSPLPGERIFRKQFLRVHRWRELSSPTGL